MGLIIGTHFYQEKIMKEADKKIYYRPELSQLLQNIEDLAIRIYPTNYAEIFYKALSQSYENENPELAAYLNEIADVFSKPNGRLIFAQKYEEKLLKDYDIPRDYVFPYYQIKMILEVYKEQFNALEKQILKEYPNLTKQEEFMVKSFMRKISAPTRYPIDNGMYKWKAYIPEFYEYIESHKEYLKRELTPTIEMFNTPDKEEDKTPENVTDDLKIREENENLDLPELY